MLAGFNQSEKQQVLTGVATAPCYGQVEMDFSRSGGSQAV